MIKIHFCWPFLNNIKEEGECYEFLIRLQKHPDVKLVDTFEQADYIIFMMDTRNCWNLPQRSMKFNQSVVEKIKRHKDYHKDIIVDYDDYTDLRNVEPEILDKVFLYFKRSVVDKKLMKVIKYEREVRFISYGVRTDFIDYDKTIGTPKFEYDICCMFNLKERQSKMREKIPHVVNEYPGKKHVGFVTGGRYHSRYKDVITEYYDVLKKSKIIVTANPPHWEGDFRLWEALLTGNLVMCDRMVMSDKVNLVNKKHLVFYKDMEELRKLIDYYTKNEKEREEIGRNGREFVLKKHKFSDRVDYVVNCILEKSK